MFFIGDVHGHFREYFALIKFMNMDSSIQVGDFGLGFPGKMDIPDVPLQHKFIRGNHDNPEVCKKSPNYLGDYGFLQEQSIYFISGAMSIDKDTRTIGVTYWDDEELSYRNLLNIIEHVREYKPRIIVSHECPARISRLMFGITMKSLSRTANAFDAVLEVHKPEHWIFGHYHHTKKFVENGTEFDCVGARDAVEFIEIPT